MKKLILIIILLFAGNAQSQWFGANPKQLLRLSNTWDSTQRFGHVIIDSSLSLYNLNGNRWFYANGEDSSLIINGDTFANSFQVGTNGDAYATFSARPTLSAINFRGFEDLSILNPLDSAHGYASFDADATMNSTLNEGHFWSYEAFSTFNGSGTLGTMKGLHLQLEHSGSGVITDFQNIYLKDVEGVGQVTNDYGIYIEDVRRGSSKNYAIYSNGGTVYLEGSVGIGTSSPTGKLDVKGGNFILSNTGVTQPITDLAPTNAWGHFAPISATLGGLQMSGFSDADATGMVIRSGMGVWNPTATTPAMLFQVFRSDNATGIGALSASQIAYRFDNGPSPLVTMFGNGDVNVNAGSLTLGTTVGTGTGSLYLKNILFKGTDSTASSLTSSAPTFTAYYGGNTNALGDPTKWLQVTLNGIDYLVPLYIKP